ncbi:MAG: hypothetical protein WC716_12800 [Chitinophagaceae bacterium]
MDQFKWIKEHLATRQVNALNHVVDSVPDLFDAYFLVHWKVGIVDTFPFDAYPEKNETIEQTNARIKLERAHGLFLNPDNRGLFREISLKEIAERFSLPYTYNMLSRMKQTPAIAILDKESEMALQASLTTIAKAEGLNLFVEDAYRFPIDFPIGKHPEQEYTAINVLEYISIQQELHYDYCTYLFPDDLSWCLTTAEDLPTVLCVNNNIKSKILNDFLLETFETDYITALT